MNISKLRKISLREIWENEAKDFTTWLKENVDYLNEALGLNLVNLEREKPIGEFLLDLLAEDEDGNRVIIENQLEKTDHKHLGQIITYLSNLDAKTAIWISSNPTEEHKKAISWLNDFTPPDISFYLIKIEAVKIEDSPVAPLFTIVVKPSTEIKEFGQEKKELAERHYLRKEFWERLLQKAKEKTDLHSNISPGIYHYISAGGGKSGIILVMLSQTSMVVVNYTWMQAKRKQIKKDLSIFLKIKMI